MKVLIATGIYPPEIGGPAKYAQGIERELQSRGVSTSLAVYSHIGRALPKGIRHLWYFVRVVTKIVHCDFVLALDTWSAGMPALFAARLFRRKFLVRIGGDFLWEAYVERTGDLCKLSEFYEKPRAFNLKERLIFRGTSYLLRHADVLFFNSAWQRDIWQRGYGFMPEKARVLENQFDGVKNVEPASSATFIGAARGIKYKNIWMMSQAFAAAQRRHPTITLDLTSVPPQEHQARLKNARAVIVSSISEINPNTIWEGIALGKPFICPLDSGCRERLSGMGLFVDTTNENALIEAIERLVDEKEYQTFVQNIRSFTYVHTWKDIADEILQVI
jgi:glycosyltransferase involved in cell wall biosynthesis